MSDDEPNVMAWTPDDEVERTTEEFRRLWPEKWEAWLKWLDSEEDA